MSDEQAKTLHDSNGQDSDMSDFHVVGIGASAGGLEALEAFFREMPTDSGAAFVVVQHLSPDFKSHMEHLLARQTEISVFRVEDQMDVKPNSIYLIPPKKEMIISEGKLLLTDKDTKSLAHPIDQFFRSLATDCGKFAVGVVLSGTGSDGSRGIRAIHETGGLVIAQSEDSAKFDGMPLNAQETGVVDVVLPPESMATAITKYIQGSLTPDQFAEQELPKEQLEGVHRVFQLLRGEFGLDFSHYKPSTVARRVNRRVELNGYDNLPTYVQRLQEDRGELNDLYKDLLIGVTRFFRDREAFERLEKEVIPSLIENRDEGDPIRVWVAGCATGEEAYSIAMLFHEQLTAAQRSVDCFKMFATDVHRTSIQTAASGVYPPDALAEVSDERRERYFREKRDGCHVVPELRKMIVFAPHNVISDAPFTQVDLVSCRNLLIYLQPSAQKKALSLFHFALKTGAMMILGPSETPGEIADEFDVIDKRWKVYRKRRDVRLPPEMRLPFGVTPSLPRGSTFRSSRPSNFDNQLLATYDRLLEQHMPPSFLVDESFDLVHTFGGAERFLERRGGRTTTNLIELIHADLKTSLSGALQHALKEDSVVRYTGIRVRTGEQPEQVHLIVQPLHDPETKFINLLVKLESVAPLISELPDVAEEELSVDELTREHIRSLEVELRFTRENLQATIEELETANEELQATNEELVASNEELQSTNEELHSVNEELYTVNTEHQKKIEELTESNDDMDNLLETTRVGVIFLDRDLCIRRFTPEIAKVLDLLPHDVGRRIDSFAHHLKADGLLDRIREVRQTDEEFETEVTDQQGHAYLLRAYPYKTRLGTEGVVLNLIDIESLKRSEEASDLRGRLLELSHDAVLLWQFDNEEVIYCNSGAERLYGYSQAEFVGHTVHEMLKTVHPAPWTEIESKIEANGMWAGELIHTTRSNEKLVVSTRHQMVTAPDGGKLVLETNRDVTEQRRTQEDLEEARQEAESASATKSIFLANVSHELRTPLTAILGFSDILISRLDNDEHLDAAQTIRRNGDYLLELVNDLLDLSKVEANRLEFRKQDCNLPELLVDACELMEVRAAQRGIPVKLRFDSKIPRMIRTDRTRLRQILVNLLSNAIKFTEEGSVELVVDCALRSMREERDVLRLKVVDTGIGIAEETQSKLFQPFAQADIAVAQKFGGTGLGLSISKRLTERLGGELSVESTVGEGSVFTLTLPLGEEFDQDDLVDPEELADSPKVEPSLDHSTKLTTHVLIVDDRRDVWRVAKYFLEKCGATVEVAEDGQQALDLVESKASVGRPFEVILMDMQMPVMTGYEATRRLRSRGCRAPIIALTAGAMKGDREKCLDAGCTDYFAKPIDGPRLVSLVNAYANGFSSMQSQQTFRILVVEDAPDVARLMATLLSAFGHEVQSATSGLEALEVAETFDAEVFLLDINLPDIDGYELVGLLKSKNSTSTSHRFYALTGEDHEVVRAKSVDAGFDGCFVKPIDPQQLNEAIVNPKTHIS